MNCENCIYYKRWRFNYEGSVEIEEEEVCTLKNIILIKIDNCTDYQEKEKNNNG